MAGWRTFAANELLTSSNVQTYLMNQAVTIFVSTASRDASITLPIVGQVCYVNSNDASEGLYTYDHSGHWRRGPGWNAPWGIMAWVGTSTPNAQTCTGAAVDLTNATITFTSFTNRLYRATAKGHFYSSVVNDTIALNIRDGSNTVVQDAQKTVNGSTNPDCITVVHYTVITAGSNTYKLSMTSAGLGTVSCVAGATLLVEIAVEDVGPSGAPI